MHSEQLTNLELPFHPLLIPCPVVSLHLLVALQSLHEL